MHILRSQHGEELVQTLVVVLRPVVLVAPFRSEWLLPHDASGVIEMAYDHFRLGYRDAVEHDAVQQDLPIALAQEPAQRDLAFLKRVDPAFRDNRALPLRPGEMTASAPSLMRARRRDT